MKNWNTPNSAALKTKVIIIIMKLGKGGVLNAKKTSIGMKYITFPVATIWKK